MIKLIASDVDGTILQNGAVRPSEELFALIRECRKNNIWFAIASGRQYPNLRRMFAPVWDDVIFVPENGALVMFRENTLLENTMPPEDCISLIRDIESQPGCEAMVCSKNSIYVHSRNRAFAESIIYEMKATTTVVDDLASVETPILKISAFITDSSAAQKEPLFADKWGERFHVALSGRQWVDFGRSTKGSALAFLQQMLNVKRQETLVMGDNYNDVPMFNEAEESYVMQGADPLLRNHAKHVAQRVEDVLAEVLAANGPVPPQKLSNLFTN